MVHLRHRGRGSGLRVENVADVSVKVVVLQRSEGRVPLAGIELQHVLPWGKKTYVNYFEYWIKNIVDFLKRFDKIGSNDFNVSLNFKKF